MLAGMRFRGANRRARWIRAFACLVVFTILGDLVFDVDCDGALVSPASGLVVAAPTAGDSPDACARGCVPDCFCCSHCVDVASAQSPAKLAWASIRIQLPTDSAPLPTAYPPYHPPRA